MTERDHGAFAARLRARVLRPGRLTSEELRAAAFHGRTSSPDIDELVRRIRSDAETVTDDQVTAVVASTGSERAAFEIVMAAAIGAGLERWDRATAVIDEATDETA